MFDEQHVCVVPQEETETLSENNGKALLHRSCILRGYIFHKNSVDVGRECLLKERQQVLFLW